MHDCFCRKTSHNRFFRLNFFPEFERVVFKKIQKISKNGLNSKGWLYETVFLLKAGRSR